MIINFCFLDRKIGCPMDQPLKPLQTGIEIEKGFFLFFFLVNQKRVFFTFKLETCILLGLRD